MSRMCTSVCRGRHGAGLHAATSQQLMKTSKVLQIPRADRSGGQGEGVFVLCLTTTLPLTMAFAVVDSFSCVHVQTCSNIAWACLCLLCMLPCHAHPNVCVLQVSGRAHVLFLHCVSRAELMTIRLTCCTGDAAALNEPSLIKKADFLHST